MEVAGLFATEIMSLLNNEMLRLTLVSKGESNDDLRGLLERPDYNPKNWMKKWYLRDRMTIQECWPSGFQQETEWRIVGAYVM